MEISGISVFLRGGGSNDVLYCYHNLLALQIITICGREAVNGIQAFSQQFAKIKHHLYIKS